MESKKIVLLLIYMFSILTVSCVSAEDLNSTDSLILGQDWNHDEMLNNPYADNETILASDSNASDPLSSNPTAQNDKPDGIYGIVDFGSNVLELKIYDVHNNEATYKLVVSEPSVVSSHTQNNKLTPEGIEKLISILENYRAVMQSNNVTEYYVFATASLRKIDNGEEVVTTVKDRSGIYIDIISEDKEAELGFIAVRDMDLTTDNGLFIDLGGGSCEIIDFENKTPAIVESMPFGSNAAYNEYVGGTFPNETERLYIQNRTLNELKKLDIDNATPFDDLFGTGGTVYTIKLMLISLGFIDENETVIPASMVGELLDAIKDDTEENRQKIIDVAPSRLYNLIPGIIITKTILEYYNVKYLHFCKGQIDDGVLFDLLENENSKFIPINPSPENESSNSSSETPCVINQNDTLNASSEVSDYAAGNPIALLMLALFSIVISYRKYKP